MTHESHPTNPAPEPTGASVTASNASGSSDYREAARTRRLRLQGVAGHIPPRSRQGDPITSDIAAESVRDGTSSNVKAAILTMLRLQPDSTDEELVDLIRRNLKHVTATEQRIRTCRNELAVGGILEQGPDGKSKAGRKARTWRVA